MEDFVHRENLALLKKRLAEYLSCPSGSHFEIDCRGTSATGKTERPFGKLDLNGATALAHPVSVKCKI